MGLLVAAQPVSAAGSKSGLGPRSLAFGIYPGGGAGTVGPAGRTVAEDPRLRLAALHDLRGDSERFVLHLYDEFTERADARRVPAWLAEQIRDYTAAGFQVELVLRYRPVAPRGDVAGYRRFVRKRVLQLGPNRGVTALQVTNEANVRVAPAAADGAYPRARAALRRGVITAKRTARRAGHRHLRIGFNWANERGRAERAFWRSLGRGPKSRRRAFRRSVDWVGLDVYPGTWGPWVPRATLARGARSTTVAALRQLRRRYLPLARLRRVRLHVSEAGYPTGPGRSEDMQTTVLRAVTRTIARLRGRYGVTDYRWFNLRDADSSSASFESQYGLMRDDYTPKSAFHAYRDIVAELG